jgi:hypothetical protein
VKAGQLNAVPEGGALAAAAAARAAAEPEVKFCKIDDPECEACQ